MINSLSSLSPMKKSIAIQKRNIHFLNDVREFQKYISK